MREREVAVLDGPVGIGHFRRILRDDRGAQRRGEGLLLAEVLLPGREQRLEWGDEGVESSHGFRRRDHGLGAPQVRAHDDLVVDVGDVHDEADVVPEVVRHHAADDVEVDVVPRVAHVRAVVYRRAADVPSDAVAVERHERHLRLGERIEQPRGVAPRAVFGSLLRVGRGPPRDGRATAADGAVLRERLLAGGHGRYALNVPSARKRAPAVLAIDGSDRDPLVSERDPNPRAQPTSHDLPPPPSAPSRNPPAKIRRSSKKDPKTETAPAIF